MKQELQAKLYEKYPKIFAQKDLNMRQTAMCWGVECGDGWFWLLDQLCDYLQFNIDNNKHPQIEAVQVKEKFGGLRFYINGGTDKQYEVIHFAENLSNSICEWCGTTKDVSQTEGWVVTLCPECMEKYKEGHRPWREEV